MFCPLLAQGMISLTWAGGHARVSLAAGQKVVPSPAVSSAMCRMWVIFKEAQVLAVGHGRQPASTVGWAAGPAAGQHAEREGQKVADYSCDLAIWSTQRTKSIGKPHTVESAKTCQKAGFWWWELLGNVEMSWHAGLSEFPSHDVFRNTRILGCVIVATSNL